MTIASTQVLPKPTGTGQDVTKSAINQIEKCYSMFDTDVLISDLQSRAEFGKNKYGDYLRINDGRNSIIDFYQEILDAIVYCWKAILEGNNELKSYWSMLIRIAVDTSMRLADEEKHVR